MRSQWLPWPSSMRRSFRTHTGGVGHVIYPFFHGDRVEHDGGYVAPKEFTYVEFPKEPEAPYYVLECDHTGDDLLPRVIAVHVYARGPYREIRASDLRGLNLEDAIEAAAERAFTKPAVVGDEARAPGDLTDRGPTESARAVVRGLRTRARRRIDHELLEEVARIYRENAATGKPTKAVRDELGLPTSTASYYVKHAREAGLDLGDINGKPHED